MTAGVPIGALSRAEITVLEAWTGFAGRCRALEVGRWRGLSTCVILSGLAPGSELVSIDHHRGDRWSSPSSHDDFKRTIAPRLWARNGEIRLKDHAEDFREAIPKIPGEFSLVFYDADHSATACADFWDLVASKLASRCYLLFDDADWASMQALRGPARDAGFQAVTGRPLVRHPGDKGHPDTYTLEVMVRG